MERRNGMTTGSCAAAAAAAAVRVLTGQPAPDRVEIDLPEGGLASLPVQGCEGGAGWARARVVKDAGDDPDITHGATIEVTLRVVPAGDVRFLAGPGVGLVTKPGLALPAGEPAINPVPRRMITAAIRKVTALPVEVMVSVPGGEALASRTFNGRLGVRGGLSILGTTGIVRPFSLRSVQETIRCALSVAWSAGLSGVVLVPGNLGRRAAHRWFRLAEEQVVEVGNEWGFSVDALKDRGFRSVLALGHPGKLAKLAGGEWDTHSGRSGSAVPTVRSLLPVDLAGVEPDAETVEALFAAIPRDRAQKAGGDVAEAIRVAIQARQGGIDVGVVLTNLKGDRIGQAGVFSQWKEPISS